MIRQKIGQSGQATMEMILLSIVLVSLAMYVSRTLHAGEYAAALTEGPWKPLQGMIEDGIWADPKQAVAMHPSLRRRHGANKPD
jgi:hypothetical protein